MCHPPQNRYAHRGWAVPGCTAGAVASCGDDEENPVAYGSRPGYTSATMPKPNGISLTVTVLWVLLVLSVVVAVASPGRMPATLQGGAMVAMAKTIALVGALISAAIGAVVIVFYSKGENWARWVVMVMSVLYIIGMLLNLRMWALIPTKVVFSALQALFGAYLLWFLNTPPIKDWFEKKQTAV